MANDADIYKRIVRRITLVILVLGLVGAIAFAVTKGPGFGSGFLVGAALSYVSFWRWKAVVDSISGDTKKRSIWLWLLRFALLIGAAYAIVKYLEVSPVAVFLGLLVSAAAVVISVIYELILA